MRRVVACFLLVSLVASGAALAGRGDPQKNFNRADQARAKAMLLRVSDLPGARAMKSDSSDDDFYCRALDESALTITGEAESPNIVRAPLIVSAASQVYESKADANTAWRQGTSAAGIACLREGFRREVTSGGDRFVSMKLLPFPRLAERSATFRVVGVTQGVRITIDFVVMMQSRAQVAAIVGVVGATPPKAELERVARVVAGRMKTAMRGA